MPSNAMCHLCKNIFVSNRSRAEDLLGALASTANGIVRQRARRADRLAALPDVTAHVIVAWSLGGGNVDLVLWAAYALEVTGFGEPGERREFCQHNVRRSICDWWKDSLSSRAVDVATLRQRDVAVVASA